MMEVVAGIDVGGTNTDAVLVSEGCIVAWAKVPTTADIRGGIVEALGKGSGTHLIKRVHIGTTAFTNALVARREPQAAAASRVRRARCASDGPVSGWPGDLRWV